MPLPYSSMDTVLPPYARIAHAQASLSQTNKASRSLFRITDQYDLEGRSGDTVIVAVDFTPRPRRESTFLRLVIGQSALNTDVRLGPSKKYELKAIVPNMDPAHSRLLPLSVQALDSPSNVLEHVNLGKFRYLDRASRRTQHIKSESSDDLPARSPPSSVSSSPRIKLRLTSRDNGKAAKRSSPSRSRGCGGSSSPSTKESSCRATRLLDNLRRRKQAVMRTLPDKELDEDTGAFPVSVEVTMSIEDMCKNWSEREKKSGRRLVKFSSCRERGHFLVSGKPITDEEFIQGDVILSCIYWKDCDSYHVTSVDIINLLEHMVGEDLGVPEKNRIRRNLQNLNPTTVSKKRPELGELFHQIMDFPEPRPRNIEKDLKIFDWNLIPQALEKIMARYTLYVYPPDQPESPTLLYSNSSSPASTTYSPVSPGTLHDQQSTYSGGSYGDASMMHTGLAAHSMYLQAATSAASMPFLPASGPVHSYESLLLEPGSSPTSPPAVSTPPDYSYPQSYAGAYPGDDQMLSAAFHDSGAHTSFFHGMDLPPVFDDQSVLSLANDFGNSFGAGSWDDHN